MTNDKLSFPFTWTPVDDEYTATTPYARLVLTPADAGRFSFGVKRRYKLRVEYRGGDTRSPAMLFSSPEHAASHACSMLKDFENEQLRRNKQARLFDTLAICSEYLTKNGLVEDLERLQTIARIVKKHFR